MTRPRFILHLGAHRTGSTSLQAALDAAVDPLREQGIVALTPTGSGRREIGKDGDLREMVRLATRQSPAARIGRLFGSQARLRKGLQRMIAGKGGTSARRVILSDETLLGPAFKRDGRAFYTGAHGRLLAFRDICPWPVDEVHLTLRSYDTFLVSVYAMRAVYAGGLPAFDDIRPALTLFDRGWPDLLDAVRDVFPKAQIAVTRIENSDLAARLRALTGMNDLPVPSPDGDRINMAPTVEAIAEALTLGRGNYDPDALVARHADGTGFSPLSDDETRALQMRYAGDLERIAARTDIKMIGSP